MVLALGATLLLGVGVISGVIVSRRSDDAAKPPVAGTSKTPVPASAARATTPGTASATPTPAADFADLFEKSRSGVVRIDVVGCTDSGVGSGFLLSPTLVATVAHVVDEATVVSLATDSQRTTGTVIGIDSDHDLALVRAESPLTGHTFAFANRQPRVGERVAAVGFPIGDPITLTQGGISGLDRDITVDGVGRTGLVETDAAVNPGNSGGPLLASDGTVLGLVDALNTEANGIAYAVPAAQAKTATDGWRAAPGTPSRPTCDAPLGPETATVELDSIPGLDTDVSTDIAATLVAYFNGINTGDYDTAYYSLSRAKRSGFTAEQFSRGLLTSYDSDLRVIEAKQVSGSKAKVALQFVSLQDSKQGPGGDTCDIWTLVYRMVYDDTDNAWLIDNTSPYNGRSHTSCG